MNVLIYLIPIALCLGLLGLGTFLWTLRSGQYDDMEGAAARILFDDEDDTDDNEPPEPPANPAPERP